MSIAAQAAASAPGLTTLGFLELADPTELVPSDLVDAVVATEKMLAHVNALQCRRLAELGRPQRCGDVTSLVAALIDKAGVGRGADGNLDDDLVAEVTRDRAI